MPPSAAGRHLARRYPFDAPGRRRFEMITLGPRRVALIAIVAALLPAAAVVGAAEPTLSDVAGCNQQAAQKTGASALPAPPGAPGREIAKRAPDDRRDARELPARGGIPAAGAPEATVS